MRVMQISLTYAQLPELAGFPASSRVFLVACALRQLRATRRFLRWLPVILGFLGFVAGVCFIGRSLRPFENANDWELFLLMLVNTVPWVTAVIGYFVGHRMLVQICRPYLRTLTSTPNDAA
jgi:hypothetical protein